MLFLKRRNFWRAPQSILFALFAFSLLLAPTLFGRASSGSGTVFIGWDPNPEPDLAGYRVYWGYVSGDYLYSFDVGLATEAELPAPSPDQPIFTAVTAYDAAGQESPFSQEVVLEAETGGPPAEAAHGRLVLLEAETGFLSSPMALAGSGSETWVEAPAGSNSGAVELAFITDVEDDYYIWCRVKAPTDTTDAYWLSMDGGSEMIYHIYGTAWPAPQEISSEWIWSRVHVPDGPAKAFTLSTGEHFLSLRTLDPGVQLDRLVITSHPDFVPSDAIPRSGDYVGIVSQPTGGTVQVGEPADFTIETVATDTVEFLWIKDGFALDGETGPTLSIASTDFGDAGSYSAFVFSGSALVTTDAAVLTVVDAPLSVAALQLPPDRSVTFSLDGGSGATVSVYASSDLQTWELIDTLTNTGGSITVQDAAAAGQARRFYRLETP